MEADPETGRRSPCRAQSPRGVCRLGSGLPGVRRGLLFSGGRPQGQHVLRKEVIQPQVLLRLPCYDLVPVARFTVGAALSPEGGLDPRLRVPPAPVA